MFRVNIWCQTLSLSFRASKNQVAAQQQLGSDNNKPPEGNIDSESTGGCWVEGEVYEKLQKSSSKFLQ